MKPFRASMFPHRVLLLPLDEGQDDDAGILEALEASVTPIPCRIRFGNVRPTMAGDAEVGAAMTYLAFPHDPGCKKGDRFVKVGTTATHRALAAAQARDADEVLFVVSCEVIE